MLTHLKGQVTSIPRPGLPVHAEVAVISNIGIGMKYLTGWWTSEILLQPDWEEWGVDNKVRHRPWVRSPLLELWRAEISAGPNTAKNCTKIGWISSQNLTVLFLNRDINKTHFINAMRAGESKAFKLRILTWTNSLNPSRSGKLKNLKP